MSRALDVIESWNEGEIDNVRCVELLTEIDYDQHDPWGGTTDQLRESVSYDMTVREGTFDEVTRARDLGDLDDAIYMEVVRRRWRK